MTQFLIEGFQKLADAYKASPDQLSRAFRSVSTAFSQEAEIIIESVLLEAAASAGQEAFPAAYIAPMLASARGIVTVSPLEVGIDFEAMGNRDDLIQGFHYGARIEGGDHVGLPYQGEALKNDVADRYIAWLRVYHGDTWHGINYAGTWTETIGARLNAWGDRAPQWLLLQYGQTEWEPTIEPFPIVENITAELYALYVQMLETEVNRIVSIANNTRYGLDSFTEGSSVYNAGQVSLDTRGRGSQYRGPKGRFVKRG